MTRALARWATTPARTGPLEVPGPDPARLNWQARPGRVGWDLVPAAALALLRAAGWCHGDPIAAWAAPETVHALPRTGPGGHHLGLVEGWWIDPQHLLRVRAHRPLRPEPGTRRFHPAGDWSVAAWAHALSGQQTRTRRWRPAASAPPNAGAGEGGADDGEIRTSSRTVDILPRAVAARLGAGTGAGPTAAEAVRHHLPDQRRYGRRVDGGWREHVYAYLRTPAAGGGERLVAVEATRAGAGTEQAIAAADWVITELAAALGPAILHDLPAPTRPTTPTPPPTPPSPLVAPRRALSARLRRPS